MPGAGVGERFLARSLPWMLRDWCEAHAAFRLAPVHGLRVSGRLHLPHFNPSIHKHTHTHTHTYTAPLSSAASAHGTGGGGRGRLELGGAKRGLDAAQHRQARGWLAPLPVGLPGGGGGGRAGAGGGRMWVIPPSNPCKRMWQALYPPTPTHHTTTHTPSHPHTHTPAGPPLSAGRRCCK
jgi:hypothetical protein